MKGLYIVIAGLLMVSFSYAGAAEEPWKAEFETLCSRTDEAASLSAGQLKEKIARCDALAFKIDALEGAPKKVYGGRLKKCRDFYVFMLDSIEKGEEQSPPK